MNEKRLIPCQLNKSKGNSFLRLSDASIFNVNQDYASTITARYYKGIGANHDNMVIEVITYEIPQKVRVRKHPVDCVDLCKCLRQHKETQKLTNRQIAEELNIPLTKVEHWFRQDGNFAIPDEDVCRCIPCGTHGSTPHLTKTIVAMRGRNPENPNSRQAGLPTEQRLEPNLKGVSNTLTSVQKDNLVMEYVNIKQATKDGYIRCKVGGDSRPFLPGQQDEEGESADGG